MSTQLITCPYCYQAESYTISQSSGWTSVNCRFCHKNIKIKMNSSQGIERITKETEFEGARMKVCPSCNATLREEAKFCGKCGYKFPAVSEVKEEAGVKCPVCGNVLKPGAKFCGACGSKIEDVMQEKKDVAVISSNLQWNILPGQIAVKITEQNILSYGDVKGVNIQEGVKALFFVGGKFTAELESGSYTFRQLGVAEEKKESRIASFFGRIADFFKGGNRKRAEEAGIPTKKCAPVTIVLIRDVDFPLVYSFKNLKARDLSGDIALHLLCKISNINDFYMNQLLDKSFVSFEAVAEMLKGIVQQSLEKSFASMDFKEISGSGETILPGLQEAVSSVYAYFGIAKVVTVSASNEALENIRRMQEELYISEQELVQLTKRNDFLNRLKDEHNQQQLKEAQTEADMRAALDKIDEQNLLTADEKDKFVLMLESQKRLREAKSKDEEEAAMSGFIKSGLLRDEEIRALSDQISHRQEMQDISDVQEIQLATLHNSRILEKENLDWEIEKGNRQFENEMNLKKQQDAYDDERRRAQIQLDKEEQLTQMEMLKEAMAIRQQREDAEHRRNEESAASQHAREMDTLNARNAHEEEMRRLFQNMTVEQIMAANPDLTEQAANAIAEKYKAEALAAQNDKSVEMAMKQNAEMQAFMQEQMKQQMAFVNNLVTNRNAAQSEEIQKVKDDAEHVQDRYVDVMKTTVQSVAGGLRPVKKCPKCGTENDPDTRFCQNCGNGI